MSQNGCTPCFIALFLDYFQQRHEDEHGGWGLVYKQNLIHS